ncbi:chorismate-binding protein [bacterium]|nr:chorismate-binding protein [bacterium]NCQ55500.1 chorismate-binding protein [Candidatus Parcubacteria bacterium]NCS67511.1 chorismate-binding protein [Candidatus Peregrinibacteria bacterium]NCS96324.1 chorismate-binding protein [bacterium]
MSLEYESFVKHVLSGQEGIFFSVKNEVVGHKVYYGWGKKSAADFDQGPFPIFSITDFKGNKNLAWNFESFETASIEASDIEIEILEHYKSPLGEIDLGASAFETQTSFVSKIEALQTQARAGEFWVANFTQALGGSLPPEADAHLLALKTFYEFLKLGKNHCGGVVITKEQIFCSLSPEIFLVQNENRLQTFPIKGTGTEEALRFSEKEIAELHMITDLMRNDLGQICDKVWLERERYLTKEQNFYHARSEVNGTLPDSVLKQSQYKKLLPAGSISGAPKARVLSLLKDVESFDRNFYTGTFGVRLSPEKSIFNILIRTLFLDPTEQNWQFPVGAGITIESDPSAEWSETLQKAEVLKDCLKPKLLP